MIVMFFVNSVVNILCGVLTGMQILSLPVDLIGALATCVQYVSISWVQISFLRCLRLPCFG